MKTTEVVFIISNVNKSLQFEWMIEELIKKDLKLTFILLGQSTSEFQDYLLKKNLRVINIHLTGNLSMIPAFLKTLAVLFKIKPDVVHTHLYHANVIGLTSAWFLRLKKRIYTRHHASLHHDNFRRGVLVDRLMNEFATHIVLPARSLERILIDLEGAKPEKIRHIPHGFDLDYFAKVDESSVDRVLKKYNLKDQFPIIGIIARFTEWKGIQYVIPAFAKILQSYPQGHLILANAGGDYQTEIFACLSGIPADRYTIIPFESDVAALYHSFHFFVHVPVDATCEAFGQIYVEALASGLPCVFTLSGIANEFIRDNVNALVVDYRNSESIETALRKLMNDPDLTRRLSEQGKNSGHEKFSITTMADKLELLYTTGN